MLFEEPEAVEEIASGGDLIPDNFEEPDSQKSKIKKRI